MPVLKHKVIFAEMQLKGNPFIKVSPTTKNYLLIKNSDSEVVVKVYNQTRDVPYSDAFNVEECWVALAKDKNS